MKFQIKLWGVRGSCPRPMKANEYEECVESIIEQIRKKLEHDSKITTQELKNGILKNKYPNIIGGNTTCIEVTCPAKRLIIDLGTGAIELGHQIINENKANKSTKELHILLTHTHWDHIQGLPFFPPIYDPSYHIHFYSNFRDLKKRLMKQQEFSFFPVSFDETKSKKTFHYIKPEASFDISPFHIKTKPLIHPGMCTSYKISLNGKTFIFATDTEFFPLNYKQIKKYDSHFESCDLLLMDGQYSILDALERQGWGHTAMLTTIDCALHWNVKHLIITHHEPRYKDKKIWRILTTGKKYVKKHNSKKNLVVHLGIEDQIYTL